MKRNTGSKQKDSARRGSKKPSSGALIPFAGSSSAALVPFAVPAAATAVVQRLDDDGATAASAAATLHGDGGGQVAVAATPVAATPSAAALTFHESEDEAAPQSTIRTAPKKRKKAPSVSATAPAAAAAAAAAQPEVVYSVEPCVRDKQCKACKSLIPEGSLHFQRVRSKGVTPVAKRSQHLGCSRPPILSSVEELLGFSTLTPLDAERVRAWFAGVAYTGASSATLPLEEDPAAEPPAETEFEKRDRLRKKKRGEREGGRKQIRGGKNAHLHDRVVTHRRSTARRMRSAHAAHAQRARSPHAVRMQCARSAHAVRM